MLKKMGYGLILWVIPYVTAIPLMGFMQTDLMFFKTIMIVEGAIVGGVLSALYFQGVTSQFLREGLITRAVRLRMRHMKFSSTCSALIGVFCLFILSGCLSPITLNRAVIAYDDAITETQSKQLLVNIARAQHHQPIHFTGVSNVAATFDFRFTAGATPALAGLASTQILPFISGSVAENPTIVSLQSKERNLRSVSSHRFMSQTDVAVATGNRYRSAPPTDGPGGPVETQR